MRIIAPLACSLIVAASSAFAGEAAPSQPPSSTAAPANYADAKPAFQLQPYSARYSSEYDFGWFSFYIDAERTLKQENDGSWSMVFEAEASAGSIRETTHFQLEDGQIHPLKYTYDASGLIQEDDQRLLFDYDQRTVLDQKKGRSFADKWQDDLQDKLSYMQQISIDLANGKRTLDYPVFEKHRVKQYTFEIVAEEQLNTQIGKLDTLKLKQKRSDNREIVAWVAKDKDYLLVRLVDRKKGKKRYQIDLVSTTL